MEIFNKLNAYEFLSYLPHGFSTVVILDWMFEIGIRSEVEGSITNGIILFLASYTLGHLIASGASALLEERIANKYIGLPSKYLINDENHIAKWKKYLLGNYTQKMEPSVAWLYSENIKKLKTSDQNIDNPFWLAHMLAIRDESISGRLSLFSTTKNFCRNMSFVLLLTLLVGSATAFLQNGVFSDKDYVFFSKFSGVALVGFYLFFRRFLKFHRQFTHEIMVSSAYRSLQPTNYNVQ